jgi:hypothetical protein
MLHGNAELILGQAQDDGLLSAPVIDRRDNEKLVEAARSGEDGALRPA